MRSTNSKPVENLLPGWEILFTQSGLKQLEKMRQAALSGNTLLQINNALRKENFSAAESAALVTQLELQQKAVTKFGDKAHKMLFTKAGLEQASRSLLTRLHAKRFEIASKPVADLGCGIGSQSIAFLESGLAVTAAEINPLTAKIAAHNLAATTKTMGEQAPAHTVYAADAKSISLKDSNLVFFDPARRTAGHKNTSRVDPTMYSPDLNFVFETAKKHSGAVKLGPAFAHEMIPNDVEAQWISVSGDLLENVLWFGDLKREEIVRSATIIKTSGTKFSVHELKSATIEQTAPQVTVSDYIYEPDPAVIRAQLIGKLADQLSGGMLDQKIAYITSAKKIDTPFAQRFKVISEAPSNTKQLSRFLKLLDIGSLEIKKRGADVDPHKLRKELKLKGSQSATIIMTRIGQKHTSYLVERI